MNQHNIQVRKPVYFRKDSKMTDKNIDYFYNYIIFVLFDWISW